MFDLHGALMIAAIAGVTFLLRALPFWIFGGKRKTPPYIAYLSEALPYAMMGMLVVYCLRNVNIFERPYGLPELLAGGTVAGLHLWKRNTLLSIAAGTAVYMILIQTVFHV